MKDYTYMELTEEERAVINREHIIFRDRTVAPGLQVQTHWHDYFELDVIVSGSAVTKYNETEYVAREGYACISTYQDSHSYEFLEETDVITIRFDETILGDELNRYISLCSKKLNCVFDKNEMDFFISEFKRAEKDQLEKPLFYSNVVSGIISDMMISIIRKSSSGAREKIHKTVQKVVELVNRSFRDDLTLKDVAQDLFVTADYLGKIFREGTGTTFSQYLTSVRLKYACSLLMSTDLSVKEIAIAAGFQSVEYFIYSFKRNMGITPGKYRAEKEAAK